MVRPSKSFLFDVLEKKLSRLPGEIGLDAASAHFKNRKMFKTDSYYGLDIDLEALKKGISRNIFPNTFALYADLTKLDLLPENSADVIVSTNTLYMLTCQDRLKAINNLGRLTYNSFLLELPIDECLSKAIELLYKYFDQVKVIYYKNIFCRFYEKIFEKNGFLGSHPIAGLKPFRLLAWLISRLEFLTCFTSFGNESAFIACSHKRDVKRKEKFDLSKLSLIDNRIYKL